MRYLGVIGHPLKRSLSPAFQQAALDHLQLDIIYEAWPTPEDGLDARVRGLRAPAVLGANVTIPHKETILPLMDETDPLVSKVGAVNTIINREGRLCAYNTDVGGFLRALREDAGFDPVACHAVITGAGGAARAAVVALCEAGAGAVTVINRTPSRAATLVAGMRALAQKTVLDTMPDTREAWAAVLPECSLLVNCTSVGSAGTPEENESPVPVDVIHPKLLVYDLIYRPAETPLMAAARQRGARVLGGLPMLIYQGAESFRIWTEREAPVDIMLQAAQKALSEEHAT